MKRIEVGFCLFVVSALAWGCGKKPTGKSVLLVTVDTLRADFVGVYGSPIPTTPNIDALAEQGLLFEDCTVQWPKTWPSVASFLTGAYPSTTGMKYRRTPLPPELTVIGEVFQQAGYTTAAIVSNFNLGYTFGFDQGFDFFLESWAELWTEKHGNRPFQHKAGLTKQYTDATIVTTQTLRWLRDRPRDAPFFLWVHYMDPHGPYLPPDGYVDLFADAFREQEGTVPPGVPNYQIQRDPETQQVIGDVAHYWRQYAREVRYLDEEIGRLMAELKAMDLFDTTLIVFSADHGESLGEHDYYFEHGWYSYQVNARVPLFIVDREGIAQGRRITHPVGLIDVSPTLLDWVGLPIPEQFEGTNLVQLIEGRKAPATPERVFMESGIHEGEYQLSMREGPWKLIFIPSEIDRSRLNGELFELYNVIEDPYETRNLSAELPDRVRAMAETLTAWSRAKAADRGDVKEVDLENLDPKAIEMLRSLGYVN
jgi:arylsulfatase A-like enzyme